MKPIRGNSPQLALPVTWSNGRHDGRHSRRRVAGGVLDIGRRTRVRPKTLSLQKAFGSTWRYLATTRMDIASTNCPFLNEVRAKE